MIENQDSPGSREAPARLATALESDVLAARDFARLRRALTMMGAHRHTALVDLMMRLKQSVEAEDADPLMVAFALLSVAETLLLDLAPPAPNNHALHLRRYAIVIAEAIGRGALP
jgi:hypothetical protein